LLICGWKATRPASEGAWLSGSSDHDGALTAVMGTGRQAAYHSAWQGKTSILGMAYRTLALRLSCPTPAEMSAHGNNMQLHSRFIVTAFNQANCCAGCKVHTITQDGNIISPQIRPPRESGRCRRADSFRAHRSPARSQGSSPNTFYSPVSEGTGACNLSSGRPELASCALGWRSAVLHAMLLSMQSAFRHCNLRVVT
jgi:hypothetical protein